MSPRGSFFTPRLISISGLLIFSFTHGASGATTQDRYYAHRAVEDGHGVIAPWYGGQNGQCDLRVRIAAETLKRYPWTTTEDAVSAAPHYVYNGRWQIARDGTITPRPVGTKWNEFRNWDNGDFGQRAAYVLQSLVDYYRYSGDAAAIAHFTYQADALLDYCQTGSDHPWPNFLISVPTRGTPYGKCDPRGMIQLDITAEAGLALLSAYKVTGNQRWFDAAKRWADLLAENRNREPGAAPWGRYANPECVPRFDTLGNPWSENKQTGGVVFLLMLFDELIRMGYTGADNQIVEARDAGRAFLKDTLLPNWTVDDTWGRNYWDWDNPVQAENVTEFIAHYMMDNKNSFPNWRNDVRNILSLFLNRTSVSPASNGDVYSGAWAFPESSGCCGRSLWYGPMELAKPFARYGVEADSEWAGELARRMQLLATYDVHETGVSEDNIGGGFIVCHDWFKIAHPMALWHVLGTMAWLPEQLGAPRENHILRASSVVRSVVYGKGSVAYTTYDAPENSVAVLRLAFRPVTVRADGEALPLRSELEANGFVVKELPCGDCIVSVRHDGKKQVTVEGDDDPQVVVDDDRLAYEGDWQTLTFADDFGGSVRVASSENATVTHEFTGNQVRLIGRFAPDGGLADVYLDGVKQLVGIDCWNPTTRNQQVLYYRNGLDEGDHVLKIVVHGAKNPRSQGANVYVDAVQSSAATAERAFGEGGGPTGPQRMIFGYSERTDYVDSAGNTWRPATEVVTRIGRLRDSVADAWWTRPTAPTIVGTEDPELYRHGIHAPDFWVNATVGPGSYRVTLKFTEARTNVEISKRTVTVAINGQQVVEPMDIAAKSGGFRRALDLSFPGIRPKNGIIEIRFTNGVAGGEAAVQAIEIVPE